MRKVKMKTKRLKTANKSPKVYISGPMSLHKDTDWNHGAFNYWDEQLTAMGFTVMNPARHNPDTTKDWLSYIIEDLEWIRKEHPEYIFLLRNWQMSAGSHIELIVCQQIGAGVFHEL